MTSQNPSATPDEPFHEVVVQDIVQTIDVGFRAEWHSRSHSANARALGEITQQEEEAEERRYELERGLAAGDYLRAIAERLMEESTKAYQFALDEKVSESRLKRWGIAKETLKGRIERARSPKPPRGIYEQEMTRTWHEIRRNNGA